MSGKRLVKLDKIVAEARQQVAADAVRERRRIAPVVLPDPEPPTCERCGRQGCAACASVDPWEHHAFDGGALGDYRCVHCGLGKASPRHQAA